LEPRIALQGQSNDFGKDVFFYFGE
jgi:hypothetical protein